MKKGDEDVNITVKEAAKLMGVSPQFVRIQMQRNLLPIGSVKKNPQGKCRYYISPKLFEEYTGIKLDEKKENIEPTKSENSL